MDFYQGIKQLYPKVPLPEKIRGFIALMHPFTIIAAVIAGFSLNYFFSSVAGATPSFWFSVAVGLVLGFLQSGGQVLNQSLIVEMEIDKVNKKDYRSTITGTVSFEEGKIFAFFLFLIGVSLAFLLGTSLGLFAFLITLFAVTYSAPPFRVKEKFLWNNVHQAVARGFLPVMYVASVYRYRLEAILFGVVLAVWIVGAQSSKDFGDEKGDRKFGVMTFPVKLGKQKALWLMAGFMTVAFVLLNVFTFLGLFPSRFYWLNLCIFPSTIIIYGLHKDIKLKRWENNLSWLMFYTCLSLWYLLPPFLL